MLLRTFRDIPRWIWLWIKWWCEMKYQCLMLRGTQENLRAYSNYVVMCFVCPLNDLFALPSCIYVRAAIKSSCRMGKVWRNNGVTIETDWVIHFWAFPIVSSSKHCCVVSFMNNLTLLVSWFTIHPFLAPTMLKMFYYHHNHKHKFTITTGKTLRDQFW